jgi:hypothetical protein
MLKSGWRLKIALSENTWYCIHACKLKSFSKEKSSADFKNPVGEALLGNKIVTMNKTWLWHMVFTDKFETIRKNRMRYIFIYFWNQLHFILWSLELHESYFDYFCYFKRYFRTLSAICAKNVNFYRMSRIDTCMFLDAQYVNTYMKLPLIWIKFTRLIKLFKIIP